MDRNYPLNTERYETNVQLILHASEVFDRSLDAIAAYYDLIQSGETRGAKSRGALASAEA
jgi:hypothetical protein